MELSQYGELFLSESREHVSAINDLLLKLEAAPASREPVEGVFRSVHTIKGMSATMGYTRVADLAHQMEELLERLRKGKGAVDGALTDLLFESADALEQSIEIAVEEVESEGPEISELLARLRAAAEDTAESDTAGEKMRLRVVVSAGSALPAVRAFMTIRAAREIGAVSEIDPPEAALLTSAFAGTLHFQLRTERVPAEVEAALRAVGDIDEVEIGAGGAEDVARGVEGSGAAGPTGSARARNIRVDLRRLDALMNQIGELVIIRGRLQRLAELRDAPELEETVDRAARLISELQDEIMQARMVPVGQVFDRFPRLVRDAARTLDKQVDLLIEGKEIEFDRSMLDEIGDPIVHLLRNSLDHGIESPRERRAAGKPPGGMLRLTAARERSQVVIRVEDDGRGIQRERVVERAVAQGLVARDSMTALGDEEIFQLLTRPGFSTAHEVTDVSGRGVGLDVVATRVRALGGILEIASRAGEGTSFTLRLPLTLAIVRALLVKLGTETYALPMAHVSETVEIPAEEIRSVKGCSVAVLRDEVVPLLSLSSALRRGADDPARRLRTAVVLERGEHRMGVEVDELVGQQEIVVKSFDATAETLQFFSGATILSDGRPALILDVGSLLAQGSAAEAVAA
ncbi:MAG: chemotaxis protein CheA [Gemmatimonadota bacterium]|nr:chemotaxis protein CheA [Gemmatimonadota bacterium]